MSQEVVSDAPSLSKYPLASLRELLYLAVPLFLGLFSASFMGLCDKMLLARYSISHLEGAVTASILIHPFQHPLMRIIEVTQAFVGLYCTSNQPRMIGPIVWQMIWVSLFSMVLTIPVGLFLAPWFFAKSVVQAESIAYFSVMLLANFLFPLGTALSVFFTGRGKMHVTALAMLISHCSNIGLDYLFIFGFKGIIPPMGAFGAALATGISQLFYCAILMAVFLKKKEREQFHTGRYRLSFKTLRTLLQAGLPRAVARMAILIAWVTISKIMTLKGGDYLLVLSVGSILVQTSSFCSEGIFQAMVAIASNIIGRQDYAKIYKLIRSVLVLIASLSVFWLFPYIIFPQTTLFSLLPDPISLQTQAILSRALIWLWLFFICQGINMAALSLITAARDMTFYFSVISFNWLTSLVPVYFAIEKWNWSPDLLWLIMCMDSLVFAVIFIVRMVKKKKWRDHEDLQLLSTT